MLNILIPSCGKSEFFSDSYNDYFWEEDELDFTL